MADYTISPIGPGDRRAMRQMDALLQKEGIQRDQNLDYSVGIFDENYELAATGSCFGNTLRCLAVSSDHQGEGLLAQLLSHLTEYQMRRGNSHLFLYTKCSTAHFFADLGFYEIARAAQGAVFMENRRHGFSDYLNHLQQETARFISGQTAEPDAPAATDNGTGAPSSVGAVVMNANPFTLGHQYLLEQAAADVRLLHVFLVSEDVSLVPFSVRRRLAKEGTAHLENLIFHQTGPYMISNATFPSYFLRDSEAVIRAHAQLDLSVFARIAQALSVSVRFVGEEPFSQVTGIYNQIMAEELPKHGVACRILPRKEDADGPISASQVRTLLKQGDLVALRKKVPDSTLRYFSSAEAEPVLARIRQSGNVTHY